MLTIVLATLASSMRRDRTCFQGPQANENQKGKIHFIYFFIELIVVTFINKII